jgi:carbon storage regulator CsrA
MLVLTRRAGETIVFTTGAGEVITLHYLRNRHGEIHLGIDAPKSVHILRGELQSTPPPRPVLKLTKPLKVSP